MSPINARLVIAAGTIVLTVMVYYAGFVCGLHGSWWLSNENIKGAVTRGSVIGCLLAPAMVAAHILTSRRKWLFWMFAFGSFAIVFFATALWVQMIASV